MFRAHRTSIGRARAANCPSSSQADRLRHRVRPIRRLTEDALRRAGIARGMRVLDLGCGVLLADLDTVDTREGVRLHAVRPQIGWMQAGHAEPKPEPWPLHPATMGIAQ